MEVICTEPSPPVRLPCFQRHRPRLQVDDPANPEISSTDESKIERRSKRNRRDVSKAAGDVVETNGGVAVVRRQGHQGDRQL